MTSTAFPQPGRSSARTVHRGVVQSAPPGSIDVIKTLLCAVLCLVVATAAEAAGGSTLLRLFLKDGSSVVSYGEFARLGERVIFSLPVGGTEDQPRLHVVTMPASAIDWGRTDKYTSTARAQWYASARGEQEFQQLSSDVARVLNEVALMPDRRRGLEIAENARKVLAEWPATHFGYRQGEVREIVALLDEAISDLRAALGITAFDLAFVANAFDETPGETLLEAPTVREQLEQVLKVASLTERAAERVALLHAGLALVEESTSILRADELKSWRRQVQAQIKRESELDAAYASLSRRVMLSATRAAAAADISGVERALAEVAKGDDKLGRERPDAVEALRASVQSQLLAARQLRLRQDQYAVRRALYNDYQRSVGPDLRQLVRLQPSLEAIRRLEGPEPGALESLRKRLGGGADRLQRIGSGVPDDLKGPHELLVSAWRFAEKAVNTRYEAVSSGKLATAWEASSAAAGALLMLSRAQHDIATLIEPPRLQ